MLSGWQAPPNIFSSPVEIISAQTSLDPYGISHPRAMLRPGFEDFRSIDQPAYVSHARRRLVSSWRNAHAHAPSEEGSPLCLPARGIDRVRCRIRWNRSELSNGSAGRV